METSDSECFESADEDFQTDDEDTKTVTSSTKPSDICKKDLESNLNKLGDLKLSENQKGTNLTKLDENKNKDTSEIIAPKEVTAGKDKENNVDVEKFDHKRSVKKEQSREGREPKRKLGMKLKEALTKESEKVDYTEPKPVPNSKPDEKVQTKNEGVDHIETKNLAKVGETNVPVKNQEKPSKVEENLWDEAEIDWGKEEDVKEVNNMWENDDWEPVEESQQPPSQPQPQVSSSNTSWGSWGSWGVSSIISTATQGVSTLTQGISTVLESGIGVPDPEELAKINKEEKDKLKEITQDEGESDGSLGFGLGNLVMGVSHLTKLVETTGTKVITGGLDTLETIGKKTMEVLQEGDPGLKRKRAFLKLNQDKPVLSQLLREAKEKAEKENKALEEKHYAKKAKNYETLFDDHQGLVHLEALEMLSKQCDIKLQTLLESYSDDALTEMQETMDQVKELCELPDEDEDEHANFSEIKEKLESAVAEINIPISYKKLIEIWEETESWLSNLKLEICDERELHQQAIETLAQLTAAAVEQYHKTGELLLVKEHRSTADEADSLVQLTTTLVSLVGIVAARFSDKLSVKSSSLKSKEEINSLITNVFFEAANSSSYIQDAFQLLIPVLQVGAV